MALAEYLATKPGTTRHALKDYALIDSDLDVAYLAEGNGDGYRWVIYQLNNGEVVTITQADGPLVRNSVGGYNGPGWEVDDNLTNVRYPEALRRLADALTV